MASGDDSEADPVMQHRPVAEGQVGWEAVPARVHVVARSILSRTIWVRSWKCSASMSPPCGWSSGGVAHFTSPRGHRWSQGAPGVFDPRLTPLAQPLETPTAAGLSNPTAPISSPGDGLSDLVRGILSNQVPVSPVEVDTDHLDGFLVKPSRVEDRRAGTCRALAA